MHLKLLRAVAAAAVLGGAATLGLGFTQPALAATTNVGCATADLISAMDSYTSGDTLVLTPHCTYWVTASLPTVVHTLTIEGNNANIERSRSADPFSIFVVGSANGHLTLENVNVTNGGGEGIDGGAIHIDPGTVKIYGGTFHNNNVSELTEDYGQGGAIYNLDGTLTVSGATFTDNSAYEGGAVYSEGTTRSATLNRGAYVGNHAEYGGAIFNDDNDMTINQGNLRYDSAEQGGAIYNEYDVTANDTLFSMNSANGEDGEGGAIYNDDETVTLNHSLIEVNHAHEGGGGIFNYESGTVTLSLDQINQNAPDNCDPTGTIDGCVG